MKERKVFLGGTCCESTWRNDLIKLLTVPYFNPVVKDWTEECQEEENRQKDEICNMHVYVITPRMKGAYSIAELIDSCHQKGVTTYFCLLNTDKGTKKGTTVKWNEAEERSFAAIKNLVDKRGGFVCNSLEEMAVYVNNGPTPGEEKEEVEDTLVAKIG